MSGGFDRALMTATRFWDYALALYSQPGIEQACLAIQDEHDGDVNTTLLCCWAGSLGFKLKRDDLDRLESAIADWQTTVLKPLRKLRYATKGFGNRGLDNMSLYKKLKAVELDAEKISQQLLVRALADCKMGHTDGDGTRHNLEIYLRSINAEVHSQQIIDIFIQAGNARMKGLADK